MFKYIADNITHNIIKAELLLTLPHELLSEKNYFPVTSPAVK